MFSFINMSMGMYFTAVTGLLNTTWLHKTRVRDKDCVKNRVKRAKIVRFTLC